MVETTKDFTRKSGFVVNGSCQDGKGWKYHHVLQGDNTRTEYRDRFNPNPGFHRDTIIPKQRKLKQKENNYRFT